MPGPLYTQSVLDLVHKFLFPLYTQLFLHQFGLWSPIFSTVCVCVYVCGLLFFFATQYLKSPAVKYKSLFFYLLANRKKDQQIYKCPF